MAGKKHLKTPPAVVTRDAVAARAGVSSATVSRVQNAPDSVSAEKVRRVREAAKELGYIPDKRASALRRAGSGVILFAERGMEGARPEDRYYLWMYADMIKAIQAELEPSAYALSLFTFRKAADIEALKARPPDGIILRNAHEPAVMKAFASLGVPCVVCHQGPDLGFTDACVLDEREGGRLAARALLQAGVTRPLHVTGALKTNGVCRERWAGFREGLGPAEARLLDGELGIRGGSDSGSVAADWVKKGLVNGIFIVNDLTAVGVVQELLAEGVRIPQDVKLIAYDNLPFIDTLPIRLATLDIGFGRLYRQAALGLLSRLSGGPPVRACLPPLLVPGESLGNAVWRNPRQ
jgi:DNA-binding LacI/PurR family transcriptional regulator